MPMLCWLQRESKGRWRQKRIGTDTQILTQEGKGV